jgi:hypothetical protein
MVFLDFLAEDFLGAVAGWAEVVAVVAAVVVDLLAEGEGDEHEAATSPAAASAATRCHGRRRISTLAPPPTSALPPQRPRSVPPQYPTAIVLPGPGPSIRATWEQAGPGSLA